MQKPTGNSSAPTIGWPGLTLMETANPAASARIAPAMQARTTVSRVDMKILDSPASTILVTNSEGTRYDIKLPLVARPRPIGNRDCEPKGIATTAPSFLSRGASSLSLSFSQQWPKQSGEPQSSLTADNKSNRRANKRPASRE